MQSEINLNRKLILLAVGFVLTLTLLWVAGEIARAHDYHLNGDFFSFWLSGRMIILGEHPYDPELWVANHTLYGTTWISDPTFLYPLPLAFIFVPLGILDFQLAAIAWEFLSLVMILVVVALLMSLWRPRGLKHYILPVLAGVFTFRPVLITLRNGQLGALLLLLLTLVVYLWTRRKWIEGGLLLPLLLLKPSIGTLIVGLATFWLLVGKRWPALLAAALSSLALASIGWLWYPGWIQEYLNIGVNKFTNVFGYSPTIWGMANMICGEKMTCTIPLGAVIAVLLIGLCLAIITQLKQPNGAAYFAALAAPVALLTTPYLWAYDQILLIIPVLVIVGCMISKDLPYLWCASFPILMSGFALFLVFLALRIGYDVWSGLLSVIAFVLVLAACEFKQRKAT